MTKEQIALKISLAMHKEPETLRGSANAYLNTYQCLVNYFQELSIDDIAGIASRYGVTV